MMGERDVKWGERERILKQGEKTKRGRKGQEKYKVNERKIDAINQIIETEIEKVNQASETKCNMWRGKGIATLFSDSG